MCGRFVSVSPRDLLVGHFAVDDCHAEPLAPSYNVAPTDEVYAVVEHKGRRLLRAFGWGLIPSNTVNPSHASRPINARAETLTNKPTFREAFAQTRCLIPSDGFYEWDNVGGGSKRPYFFQSVDGDPLAFAGLWDAWEDPTGANPSLCTCAIVTTAAREPVLRLHDRMPVVVEPGQWDVWLDADSETDDLRAVFRRSGQLPLDCHPVSTRVNDVRNNGPGLVDPIEVEATLW